MPPVGAKYVLDIAGFWLYDMFQIIAVIFVPLTQSRVTLNLNRGSTDANPRGRRREEGGQPD